MENLPLFLHHFGPVGLPLTLELIEQAVDSKVTFKLATQAGSLVCSMTHKTKIIRSGARESLVKVFFYYFQVITIPKAVMEPNLLRSFLAQGGTCQA